MVDRASPVQQRKALEIANTFTRMGVGFVPMPVANAAEFDAMMNQAIEKLASMEHEAAASQGVDRKGAGE